MSMNIRKTVRKIFFIILNFWLGTLVLAVEHDYELVKGPVV